ncbi:hypothetical protein FACS189437_06990 [Bacteroidia bacterium]|nr:hypothetical protein FACS189437_06990 [Bacteroidia bacterium]
MEYKSYSSDMDKILYSPYYAALGDRNHLKDYYVYSAMSYLDGKDSLTRQLAEKYGADPELTKALLYARELGRPPLDEVGERFLQDEVGITSGQASVLVAKEIRLSDELVGELARLETPSTDEGLIVKFVNANFDKLPSLVPSTVTYLLGAIYAENGQLQSTPEVQAWIGKYNIFNDTSSLLQQQEEFNAIKKEKLAILGKKADEVLWLHILPDWIFKISELAKSFSSFVQDRGKLPNS